MVEPILIILGASARAAAQSASDAGYRPHAIDLFGDADLRLLGGVTQIARYPAEFLTALARAPQAPWIYTGGLENYPRLVSRLARLRPLLGNGPETLRKTRDPGWLAELLAGHAVRYPQTNRADWQALAQANDSPAQWLIKPRRSGGGLGIRRFHPDHFRENLSRRVPFLQRFIPGQSCSAAFLAADGRATWIGAAEQWIGPEWGAPGEFQYAGALAPACVSVAEQAQLLDLAQRLTAAAGLRGVFGCDLVRNEHGLWLIEVNPRYTASLELHERRAGNSLMGTHCAAFSQQPPVSITTSLPAAAPRAKLIVYATHQGIAGERFQQALTELAAQGILAADIPVQRSVLAATSPICTLFATAADSSALPPLLLTAAARVQQSLVPS